MLRGAWIAAGLALAAAVIAPVVGATTAVPWEAASALRLHLSEAQTDLILGDLPGARAEFELARASADTVLVGNSRAIRSARAALDDAAAAATRGDDVALAASRATIWTAVLQVSYRSAIAAAARGDIAAARAWLRVREFRPPTRFTRATADATVALDRAAAGAFTPARAAAAVRADLLDTYDGRIRTSIASVAEAARLGFAPRRAESGALALGYWRLLEPSFRAQRGARAAREASQAFVRLADSSLGQQKLVAALIAADAALEGFRAAPLSEEAQLRRAGQLERFLKLVPIEYGRGVESGRVTRDFEIQEAITFRDGAEAAFDDLEPILLGRDATATRAIGTALARLDLMLEAASRGGAAAEPEEVSATSDRALGLAAAVYPKQWADAGKSADFDVIAATLDRLEGAAASGEWGSAEQARLEAYGIFELGPEQRLRGLAPSLFREIEGFFWYGASGKDGLVQLLKSKSSSAELAATRAALDDALSDAEARIGSGPQSRSQIVTNSAIIVFREGLEAVLILAALMASMVGPQRRHRRPLLIGVGAALIASAATWAVAETVLGSLSRYGERLEAVVSLIAIAILLLILNWFYHRVYWQEHLQELHGRKRTILRGTAGGILAAQVVGLAALGFTSVYREGFETVLFLQALSLEAGVRTVAEGVAIGLAATVAIGFLVVVLERRLPHKKMLIATGVLITWVLAVMVGHTVQTMQVVGWLPISPIEGLTLPYWSGLWLGVFPTWEGVTLQLASVAFVIGSYVAAEWMRGRKRARILAEPISSP